MKKSYIGAWRRTDNRMFSDRAYGRPPAQDIIVRVDEDGGIEKIIPAVSKLVEEVIRIAISSDQKPPHVTIRSGISVRIYNIINKK